MFFIYLYCSFSCRLSEKFKLGKSYNIRLYTSEKVGQSFVMKSLAVLSIIDCSFGRMMQNNLFFACQFHDQICQLYQDIAIHQKLLFAISRNIPVLFSFSNKTQKENNKPSFSKYNIFKCCKHSKHGTFLGSFKLDVMIAICFHDEINVSLKTWSKNYYFDERNQKNVYSAPCIALFFNDYAVSVG